MARPSHNPTDVTRGQVNAFAMVGTPETDIAAFLNIDPKTLRKHYRRELDTGHIAANLKVAQSLFKAATATKPTQGTVTAQIWWTKTRMGWKEPPKTDTAAPPPVPGGGAEGAPAPAKIDLSRVSTNDLEILKSTLERISGGPEGESEDD